MPITNIRGQQILNGTVQYVDIQQVTANRLVGNATGSAATMAEISLGTGLSFSSGSVVLSANLQSLSALSYSSASFVKMTAAGTFALDTAAYSTGTGASGQVAYWTGTSTQAGNNNLFWDITNGRLGIGTNSPGAKLDVNGSVYVRETGTLYTNTIGGYTSSVVSIIASTNFIVPSGNVGIGTANPTDRLHVANTGEAVVKIQDLDGTNQYLNLGHNGGSSYFLSSNGSSYGDFVWYGYNGTLFPVRMKIDSSGNVGIGTASPIYRLDVNSSVGSGNIQVRLTQGFEKIRINTTDVLGYTDGLWIIGADATATELRLSVGGAWDWDRQVQFNYAPGTTGSFAGVLKIGQTNKNDPNYTHGVTELLTKGIVGLRLKATQQLQLNAYTSSTAFTGTSVATLAVDSSGNVITIANSGGGTVTSVSGTGTVSGLTLTGTVTSSGSLTLGGTLSVLPSNFSTYPANTVFAGPTTGGNATPSFRGLVAADIPALPYLTSYTETSTLDNVLARGNSSNRLIQLTGATSSTGLDIQASATANAGSVVRIYKTGAANQAYVSIDSDQLYFVTPANNTTDADVGTKGSVNLRLATNYTTRINIGPTGTIQLIPLTSNGFLKTSGGNGTLSVDTNTYLIANQSISISGDASGSGTTAITLTFATVNSNVGTFNNVTVNAKGLVTAASNVSYLTGNQTITLTGNVTGSGTTSIATTIANGVVTNAMLANSSFHVGTTSISLGRASAAQTLTGVSIDGNAGSATFAYKIYFDDGPRDLSNRLPNSFTRQVLWDFVTAGTVGGTGNYAGVMTFMPWTGTTASTGDSSYQLAFINESSVNGAGLPGLRLRKGIDTTWGTWYTLVHAGNISSYGYLTSAANWFGAEGTGGTLDWNHVSNTRPGTGVTLLLGSATNGPGGGNYYHSFNLEYSSKNGTGNVTQLAVAYGTPANDIKMRGRYDGSWSSWVTVWTSATLTNLNQLTNGPGYITSSALGSYLPLSGGTLTGALTISNGADLNLRAGTSSSDSGDIVFQDGAGAELHRLWNGTNTLNYRTNGGTSYGLWHSGNLSNSFHIGTTSITLGRGSAAQALTGITSIDGYAVQLSGYANQTVYTILTPTSNINGPVIKVRYDGSTVNRYIDIGSIDGNGNYTEGLKLYNNSTITWLTNTVWHGGNDGEFVKTRSTVVNTNSSDFNSFTFAGTYQVSGNGTWTGSSNGPTSAYSYGQLVVTTNSTIVTQFYYSHSTNGHWIRSKYNASDWQSWQRIWTDANLTNVATTSQTYYIGTTQNALNRASGAQTLTGVSIDGTAAGETLGTVTSRGATTSSSIQVSKTAHTAGADNYHLEVYSPNTGDSNLEVSIRFHHANQYYAQIRYNPTGFRLTAGNNLNYVPLYAGNIYSNGNLVLTAESDTLNSVTGRGNTTTNIIGVTSESAGHDPYGKISVTRGTASNFSYFGLTRAGNIGWSIGVNTSNAFIIGTGASSAGIITTTQYSFSNGGTLTVLGDVIGYGSPSDARYKTIKEHVPNALEKIQKLNGYRFDWTKQSDVFTLKEDIGVIAQEVAEVLPELARTNEDGYMSVRYQGLTAVLIEAVKEQQKQIEDLKKQIEFLAENR